MKQKYAALKMYLVGLTVGLFILGWTAVAHQDVVQASTTGSAAGSQTSSTAMNTTTQSVVDQTSSTTVQTSAASVKTSASNVQTVSTQPRISTRTS